MNMDMFATEQRSVKFITGVATFRTMSFLMTGSHEDTVVESPDEQQERRGYKVLQYVVQRLVKGFSG